MCIANPRKSWLSLVVGWPSLSNRDPHIFSNVVVSSLVASLVESLEVHLGVLEYLSFDSLVGSWDEVDAPNGLKGAKACFRWLSSLYDEFVDMFRVEMWLKERLCSWDGGEEYVRCGMLDKVAKTVDEWRWDNLLYGRRRQKRGEKRFWESTGPAFSNAPPNWSHD